MTLRVLPGCMSVDSVGPMGSSHPPETGNPGYPTVHRPSSEEAHARTDRGVTADDLAWFERELVRVLVDAAVRRARMPD